MNPPMSEWTAQMHASFEAGLADAKHGRERQTAWALYPGCYDYGYAEGCVRWTYEERHALFQA